MDKFGIAAWLLLVCALFSIGLLASTLFCVGGCFTTPCYEGTGLDMVWSIHSGESFEYTMSALVACVFPIYTFFVLFRWEPNPHSYGIALVWSIFVTGLVLLTAIAAAQDEAVVDGLVEHLGSSSGMFYQRTDACTAMSESSCNQGGDHCFWHQDVCLRGMSVNTGLATAFRVMYVFAFLVVLVSLLLVGVLTLCRSEFLKEPVEDETPTNKGFQTGSTN
eukprot:c4349_g1_i1.p1 GENE.c4349_g1_i1~~c4349_g1_i1.p1  ORF type:complete len:220 (+),score=41.55 c4349_g1_i1:29-688(+)